MDKPAKYDPTDVGKPEAGNCEPIRSEIPTRWRRIKEHSVFKPVLAAAGLVAVGGVVFLTSKSQEGSEQTSAAILDAFSELARTAFEGIGAGTSRKPPIEHTVNGYERIQHFGPGGTETRVVQVPSYSRGGRA